MKVILVMVSSVNGKITKGPDPDVTHWTSTEDQKLFSDLKKNVPVIIMGSRTYDENNKRIQLSQKTLRIVLSTHIDSYRNDTVPGQLEFSDESPAKLIQRLGESGVDTVLLVGGSQINSSFFKEKLIDELHITIEPQLFGTGKNLLEDADMHLRMKLVYFEQLNPEGTIHLIYKIV